MEEILMLLGATEPLSNDGDLTLQGADAYDILIDIIEKLHRIGVITETVDDCEKKFNEICRHGF